LISLSFAGHPENLWITLLKTCREGLETLENQGFACIAYQMCIENKFNKINDLGFSGDWPSGCETVKNQKAEVANFVHKSRGQASIFKEKCGLTGLFCAS
jgi:hypothetical protein